MALYTVLAEEELAAAVRAFGLPAPERVRPEPKGGVNSNYHVWSAGRRFFLRVNEGKSDADVRFEGEVLRFLEEARFPVPRVIPAPDGRPFVEVAGRQAMLFDYVPGEEVARDAVTPDRCRRIGEQLARLHDLAGGFTAERPNPYGPARVSEWIAALRPDGGGDAEVAAALPLLERELARATALPGAPRGLVHGDLFTDNVLWIGDRVSAVLDWEMACTDPFALDLGIALSAWCYGHAYDRPRASALMSGYRSRRKVEPETLEALYPWTRFAALRFAVSRIHGYHRAGLGDDRLVKKDWRRYRDRLAALVEMGEAGFSELVAIPAAG
jgi:homoserine kinase type II